MAFTDFYEELGVSEHASLSEIQTSIKDNRRRYRALAGSPNLDQRSLAERKMHIFSQADEIFSSEASRAQYDRELQSYRARRTTSDEPKSSTVDVDSSFTELLARARSASEAGNINAALGYARKAVEKEQGSLEAWKLLATIAWSGGHYDLAEQACTEAFYLNSQDAEICALLGQIQVNRERYPEALAQFDKAYTIAMKNPYETPPSNYLMQKAATLELIGKYKEAARIYEELYETIADPRLSVGSETKKYFLKPAMEAYKEAKDLDKARSLGRKLLELDPDFSDKASYCDILPIGTAEREEMQTQLLREYGADYPHIQRVFVYVKKKSFFQKHGTHGTIKLDTKEKVRSVKTLLDELKLENITDSEANQELLELSSMYDFAQKRHFVTPGCASYAILSVLGLVGKVLYIDSKVLSTICFVLMWFYISNFIWVPGWKLNKRGR